VSTACTRARFVPDQSLADRLRRYVAREAIETWAARKLLEPAAPDLTTLSRPSTT
jgi:hypothetical protein